jgi:hypothetical protein
MIVFQIRETLPVVACIAAFQIACGPEQPQYNPDVNVRQPLSPCGTDYIDELPRSECTGPWVFAGYDRLVNFHDVAQTDDLSDVCFVSDLEVSCGDWESRYQAFLKYADPSVECQTLAMEAAEELAEQFSEDPSVSGDRNLARVRSNQEGFTPVVVGEVNSDAGVKHCMIRVDYQYCAACTGGPVVHGLTANGLNENSARDFALEHLGHVTELTCTTCDDQPPDNQVACLLDVLHESGYELAVLGDASGRTNEVSGLVRRNLALYYELGQGFDADADAAALQRHQIKHDIIVPEQFLADMRHRRQ